MKKFILKLSLSVFLLSVLTSCTFTQYNPTRSSNTSRDGVTDLFGRLDNSPSQNQYRSERVKRDKKRKGSRQNGELTPLAQDEVSLIVTGDGFTKDEATKVALRSAIEQAFGTFVSSNTAILNDRLVKDEIVTVSSGNIKSYEYISEYISNGKYNVVVKTVVSIGKLISYTQAKGGQTELAGAEFIMDVKMKKLYKENEEKAIEHLLKQLNEILPNMLDYSIRAGNVRRNNRGCIIDATVTIRTNNNYQIVYNLIWNTLSALCLKTDNEIRDYENKGIRPTVVCFYAKDGTYTSDIPLKTFEKIWGREKRPYACFRSDKIKDIAVLFQKSIRSFIIDYGADKCIFTRWDKHYTGQKGEFKVHGFFPYEAVGYYNWEANVNEQRRKRNGIRSDLVESTYPIEKEELVNFGYMCLDHNYLFPVSNSANWHMKGTLHFTDDELENIKTLKIFPCQQK